MYSFLLLNFPGQPPPTSAGLAALTASALASLEQTQIQTHNDLCGWMSLVVGTFVELVMTGTVIRRYW
jgi:hypothetical protein